MANPRGYFWIYLSFLISDKSSGISQAKTTMSMEASPRGKYYVSNRKQERIRQKSYPPSVFTEIGINHNGTY